MSHKSLAKVRTARSKKTTDIFRRAQAYLQAGAAFEKAGKMPQAEAAYKKAQELFKRAARSGMLFGPVGRLPNSKRKARRFPTDNMIAMLRDLFPASVNDSEVASWLLERVSAQRAKVLMRKLGRKWPKSISIVNPSPPLTEWNFDDSDIEAAMKLGARQAMQDRKSARERAREQKAAAEREQKAWQVSFYSKKNRKRLTIPFAIYAETKAAVIAEGKARQSGDPKDRVNWTAVRVNPSLRAKPVRGFYQVVSAVSKSDPLADEYYKGPSLSAARAAAKKTRGHVRIYFATSGDDWREVAVYRDGREVNPTGAQFIARDSSRTCYHCGKLIRKGSLLVAGLDRMPYHQKCYMRAEKDAALELQRLQKRNPKDRIVKSCPHCGTRRRRGADNCHVCGYQYQTLWPKTNPGLIDLAANLQAAQSVKDLIAPGKRRKRNAGYEQERCANPKCKHVIGYHDGLHGKCFAPAEDKRLDERTGRNHLYCPCQKFVRKSKRNPSIKATSQLFQGAASGKVSELKAANSAPSDLARIGKLVFIKLAGASAQTRIPGAMVAVDKSGKLWLCGSRAPMFRQKAKPGEALDYGYIDQVCYFTTKRHLDNAPTEYVHSFGEEGGKRPRLLVDHEGMPILRGGDYKITADGIVN